MALCQVGFTAVHVTLHRGARSRGYKLSREGASPKSLELWWWFRVWLPISPEGSTCPSGETENALWGSGAFDNAAGAQARRRVFARDAYCAQGLSARLERDRVCSLRAFWAPYGGRTNVQGAVFYPLLSTPGILIPDTSDLRALRGIKLCAGVKLHKDELHSSKQQDDIALNEHVASVCSKCFSCFRGILQGFRVDVTKVDRDVP
jgi:hypothetical protein